MVSSLLLCVLFALAGAQDDITNATLEDLHVSNSTKQQERLIVSRIPELPASVAKPGVFDNGIWFVLFYAPWCDHSQAALPHFTAAVQYIVDHNMTGVSIGKLDISKEQGLARWFNIHRTPVISMYRNGYRHNFDGDITTEGLITFADRIYRANVSAVESTEQLTELQTDHSVLFILIHDRQVDTDWQQVYTKVALELALRGTFVYTLDPTILDSPPSKLPAVLVIKDKDTQRYTGSLAGHSLYKWALGERFAALPTVTMDTLRQYMVASDARKLVVLAVHKEVSQRRIAQKKALEVVKKLAHSRQYQKVYQFVLTEGLEVMEHILRRSLDDYPLLVSYDIRTGYYNVYRPGDKGFAESAIVEFLKLVQASKLEFEGGPTIKDRVLHLYRLVVSVIQATLFYHPYIGAIAALSMMGVAIFYIFLCCQSYTKRKIPKASRSRAKQMALARRHDNNTLRHRHSNHSNEQEEDMSDNSEIDENESSKDK